MCSPICRTKYLEIYFINYYNFGLYLGCGFWMLFCVNVVRMICYVVRMIVYVVRMIEIYTRVYILATQITVFAHFKSCAQHFPET